MEKKSGRVVEIMLDKYIIRTDSNEYLNAILKGTIKKKNSIK